MTTALQPWLDHAGRFSALKAACLALLFVPAAALLWFWASGTLGPRPLNEAIHEAGLWAIRLLFISLAVTPLRHALDWPRLLLVRRMIGVAAFCYLMLHFALYAVDQRLDVAKIASEIWLRVYLTIGFTALLLMAALAATSWDGAVKRMGGRAWQRLHRLAYPIALLALVHYFMQSKLDLWEPSFVAGFVFWLLAWRVVARRRRPGLLGLAALGLGAALATALGEALWFNYALKAPLGLVLEANLGLATGLRPAWIVLGAGAAIVLLAAVRQLQRRRRTVAVAAAR